MGVDFGKEVIAEMNRLGIMVDISHVSDDAFRQVLEITRAPVIASHSSARHFTPGFERNMTDEMVTAIAAAGVPVFAYKGETLDEYWDYTHRAMEWADGGVPNRISYDNSKIAVAQIVGRRVAPTDIAPTLAACLGIKPPSGSVGSVLTEVLP